ncbi:CAP domain-containing protein [Acidimangrovimonas sediminis]|uniref:CAP domain-containing protein n=1 Tax=Acidimangrovimonas sediminis TaxID=2056283 RepID=UPI000C801DF4|nr:CAP domain-containing protein [Acidimangrovimonas sediminis]
MKKTALPRTLSALTLATVALGALSACAPEPAPAPTPSGPPPIVPSTPGQCSIPTDIGAFRADLLAGINAERAKKDLPALTVSPDLQQIAQQQSCDDAVQGIYSHTGLDGSSYEDRFKRIGYSTKYAEENTGQGAPAEGNDTVKTIVGFWMLSTYHRKNMLNKHVTELGIGRAHGGNGNDFWVVDFGKP